MATKYVCNGASCFCDKGTNEGFLKVISQNTVFIQGKLMATENDTTFESPFFGGCSEKKGNPCSPIINSKWENPVNNVNGKNSKAILETSTIRCDLLGKIKITNSSQSRPEIVIFDNYSPPLVTPLPKQIVSINWKNNDLENDIDTAYVGEKVSLVVETKNYKEGETVVIVIDEVNGKNIKANNKLVKFSGEVNANGLAILREEIAIENEN